MGRGPREFEMATTTTYNPGPLLVHAAGHLDAELLP